MTDEQISLASKQNYFCNSRFISGRIIEYDLRAANISMCRQYGIINDDYYRYLLNSDKQYREEFIGWQIRKEMQESGNRSAIEGSKTYNTIYEGIKKAKLQLFEANNIQPEEVVRIANDAVYINRSSDLVYTKFSEFIEFRKKIVADTVIKLSPTLIIFYWSNVDGLNIEVKGIGDESKIQLHQNYMLSFIGSVLLTYERAGVTDAIHLIEDFYNDYLNRKLDIRFYRELNSISLYKIINSGYYLEDISDINVIDISYNANIIRELWKIIISKYG